MHKNWCHKYSSSSTCNVCPAIREESSDAGNFITSAMSCAFHISLKLELGIVVMIGFEFFSKWLKEESECRSSRSDAFGIYSWN